jgi:hypothetical protein
MDYKIYGYVALGLLAVYLAIRAAGEYAVKKLVRAEFDHVLNHEEHKVKGRYG